jgi:Outer membrane protein beta-barrel domain
MSHLRNSSVLLLLATLVVAPRRARAETEAPQKPPALPQVAANSPAGLFGGRGQLAISNDLGLLISNTSQSGGGSTTSIQLRPALDYFVIDNLSVGAFIGLDYTHVPDSHQTIFDIGPRVGYNVPLSDVFSVWGRVGLSYTNVNLGAGNGGSTSSSSLTLNLSVPFLFHVQNFFFGFGPALDVDLTGDVKSTTIAGRLTFGGWM